MNAPQHTSFTDLLAKLEADLGDAALRIATVRAALSSGATDQASRLIQGGLTIDPEHEHLRFLDALIPMRRGQWAEALKKFEALRDLPSMAPLVVCEIAHCDLELGHPERGLEVLRELSDDVMRSIPQSRVLEAKLLHALRRFDESVQSLFTHLAEHRGDLAAESFLSMVLLDSGRTAEAEKIAAAVLARSNRDPAAHIVLGYAGLARGRPDLAEPHFRAALAVRPDSGRALTGIGYVAAYAGDLVAARDHLVGATQRLSSHLGTWHALAWIQLGLKDLPAARVTAQHVLELDRTLADSHGLLAVIEYLEGQLDAAQKSLRRCLRLNSACSSGIFAQSLIESRDGRTELANEHLLQLIGRLGLHADISIEEAAALFEPSPQISQSH